MFGPTAHTAKPAAASKADLFAMLRGPHRAPGSGAPTRGLTATAASLMVRSLIAVCALVVLLALSTEVARAEVPGLVPNGTFASDEGLGVAVDQSSGDVFVTGFTVGEQAHSEKFDASGERLSPPSPFAEGFNYGAAVNPTNGDLYVASPFAHEIDTYDPNTGEPLSSFPVPAFFTSFSGLFENQAQIATDSAGDVYVPNVPGNEVLEYGPHPACSGEPVECVPLKVFTGSGAHALSGPTGVAVDSSGDVWVADDGDNRIEEFDPTGAFLSEIKSEGVRALALDRRGDVLAIVNNDADSCGSLRPPCAHLVEYSASGAQLADLGAGDFGSAELPTFYGSSSFSMVAVDNASGRVYVTDAPKSRVWVFQPPLAPVLGEESAVEVGAVEAKLGALVNPGGAQTTYRFEYDTREYRQGEGAHGVSVPFPEGSVGEGFSSRAVWASAKGLAPGTTYHYRAVVTNGVGNPVVGPDQTFTTETTAGAACPNEQLRFGFSAALPDCRAYELVTPANKASAQPDTGQVNSDSNFRVGNYAANDGSRYSYISLEVMPGSQSAGLEFIATRGASGWTSEDALPLTSYTGDRCPYYSPIHVVTYSANLSRAVLVDHNFSYAESNNAFSEECQGELREVVPGEPVGAQNLLLRNNVDGSYQLINITPSGVVPTETHFAVASANLSLVVFSERAKLTPEALNNTVNTYEWHEGVVRLLKFALPSGAPVAGGLVSISPDGSEMFFTAGGNLYVRVNDGRTVQVDEARGGAGPGGGGSFRAVTADGSQVFFTADASAGLTSDTVPGSGTNLYRYDIVTGQLSDLAAKAGLAGISEDGSYVYFSSESVLSGTQANQFGETAESGKSNLYVDHGGTITFVWHGGVGNLSSNGAFFASGSSIYSAASNRFESAPVSGAPVSDNGQVFFETGAALLPRDTNGRTDVYEWSFNGGLHLISSGSGSSESFLLLATPSGNDVFVLTRQNLVPQDNSQEANKIYDARVDGGFPEPAVPPGCTTADACRAAPEPQPSIFGEPASQTFSGVGNLASGEAEPKTKPKAKPVQCRRGFLKRKGICVKKSAKKARKSAHANRRGK